MVCASRATASLFDFTKVEPDPIPIVFRRIAGHYVRGSRAALDALERRIDALHVTDDDG